MAAVSHFGVTGIVGHGFTTLHPFAGRMAA